MTPLHFLLFGQFRVRCGDEMLTHLFSPTLQQLLCYLLLFRDRSHPRETLASLLWGNTSTARSKKYLRQALWQLQNAWEAQGLKGIEDEDFPHWKEVLKKQWYYALPLIIITILMIIGKSPGMAAFWSALSCIVVSWVRQDRKVSFQDRLSPA